MENNISLEEKIDFIYKKLKKDEKNRKIKLFIKYFSRLSFILIIIYMYFFWINQIINWVKKSILEFWNLKKDNTIEYINQKTENIKDFFKKKR